MLLCLNSLIWVLIAAYLIGAIRLGQLIVKISLHHLCVTQTLHEQLHELCGEKVCFKTGVYVKK